MVNLMIKKILIYLVLALFLGGGIFMVATQGIIDVRCYAPSCDKMVTINKRQHVINEVKNLFRFGYFLDPALCPEHLERVTSGKISDDDPNTNPDLNKQ